MIRKIFLGVSLLAIAGVWTGCSNDEVMDATSSEARAIDFRVQGGVPTVSRTTATTAANVDAFVVYGADYKAANDASNAELFKGETVARQAGTTNKFDYNPKKYYSTNAIAADFVAYSPVNASRNFTGDFSFIESKTTPTAATASFTYTVPAPTADGKTSQEDLLVAGVNTIADGSGILASAIKFDFKHALSRIFVKALNPMPEPVVITNLTLKNLNAKGTITGATAAPATGETTAQWTWTWALPAGDAGDPKSIIDYPYILANSGISVPAGMKAGTDYPILVTSMEQGMMVLPQETVNADNKDVTGGDFALEVKYNVSNLTGKTAYVYLTDKYKFEMNKQYAITISFDSHTAISFTIAVDNFTNDTSF
ncbi:fimbrillin family protein [Bacteroides sp. OttesenSCG-928-J23]|nr:fimbrillin family protein [Bacteroides sp. OttesenSCG-928-J23]